MVDRQAAASVPIELGDRAYDVHIAPGLLEGVGARLRQLVPHARAVVVADENVRAAGHTERLVRSLADARYHVALEILPEGEATKSIANAERLYSALARRRIDRGTPIVALGGGVTGDLTGFVAATYLRGVPFVQCPTTLLSMVDSSVGGKVAVNLPEGKNLVGAFHQPRAVFIDTTTLCTLPPRELRSGLAECIKHGFGLDASLFGWIEENAEKIAELDPSVIVELVRWNVAVKAAIVIEDETEAGRRALLNLGHTFGHALEATSGYALYKHGEAVALGCLAASSLAVRLDRLDTRAAQRFADLALRIGLPTRATDLPDDATLALAMSGDKKVEHGRLRFVLPTALGRSEIVSGVPDDDLRAAWQQIR